MLRTITATLVAAAAVALAACGSGAPTPPTSLPSRQAERRARRPHRARPGAGSRRGADQGLRVLQQRRHGGRGSPGRRPVPVGGRRVADKVADLVRSSAPKPAPLIVNGNAMVVYARAGTDAATASSGRRGASDRSNQATP